MVNSSIIADDTTPSFHCRPHIMHYLQRSAAPSMTASYIATVRVYVSRVMVRVSPVARYSGLSMIQGINTDHQLTHIAARHSVRHSRFQSLPAYCLGMLGWSAQCRDRSIQLRFYVPPHTKQVISETFFAANLFA